MGRRRPYWWSRLLLRNTPSLPMSFHPFFDNKKQLAELWEHRWCSVAGHETAPPDVHRKVIRICLL